MRKLIILYLLFLVGCSSADLNDYITGQEKAISGSNVVLHFKSGDSNQLNNIATDIARYDPAATILILPEKTTTYLWNTILSSGYKDHSEPDDLSYQDDIILIASSKIASTDKGFNNIISKVPLKGSSFGPFNFNYGKSVWIKLKVEGFDFNKYRYMQQN